MRSKKIALYVHDFQLEIGHSNSLIELIRNLPFETLDQFTHIEIVSYSCSDLNKLFKNYKGSLTWKKVPFPKIRPVLLKSIFYQMWVFLYNMLSRKKSYLKIGIGISSLDVDAVSIQFLHHQWTDDGLKLERAHRLRYIYKKILFWYFEKCEKYLFSKKETIFFSPAMFLTEYLKKEHNGIKAYTVYSGVDLNRFVLKNESRIDLFNDLKSRYPELQNISPDEPIYLFVGAYERKGISEVLSLLEKYNGAQLIVIGSPSSGKKIDWPGNLRIARISFTKEVSKFYSLADAFVFPTIYEPFGLVLFEAMAMGLTIITKYKNVGASELLINLPEVYFIDKNDYKFEPVCMKSYDEKSQIREKRLNSLGDVSWKKAGKELEEILFLVK